MTKKLSERPFYRERKFEGMKRRWNPGGSKRLNKFFVLIEKAMAGDAAPLRRYVVAQDELLPAERWALAWLIGVGFQHGKVGRPEGTRLPRAALAEMRRQRTEWQKRWRRTRVPANVTKGHAALVVKKFAPTLDGKEASLINALRSDKKNF